MQAIAHKTLMFIGYEGKKAIKYVIKAAPGPQDLPDWVAKLPAFQRAVKARAIVGVRILEETDLLAPPLAPRGKGRAVVV